MFQDKKILILGFARSGYEATKFLVDRNNEIIVNDKQEIENVDSDSVKELEEKGVEFVFGSHPKDLLDDSFDYLIKSPGIGIDHPYVLRARELGIEVINESEMAYRLIPRDKNIKIISVTGTNGKTTTTTLIYEFLKEAGKNVYLAGNIGFPLCGFIKDLKEEDIIVDEVSCQQLEDMKEFHPNIAILTNIGEAHLEFMKTCDHYKDVKKKLFQNQTIDDIAITNMENNEAMTLLRDIKSTMRCFSSNNQINGAYIEEGMLYYFDEQILAVDKIKLVGKHNYENIMAAVLAVKEIGVTNSSIVKVLKEFGGVEHRLEFVREVDGRKFYNDTEATNIKCCQIALQSFDNPVILFLGGYERGQDFNELKDYCRNVKIIMAIGECRNRVVDFANSIGIEVYSNEKLSDAFKMGWLLSERDDVLLLSPASASWDQYKQCEDRGSEFKKNVNEL